MQRGRSITHVNDSVLVDHIQAANRRVLFMAPGVSKAVADALTEAGQRIGQEAVDVIIDMDPEVYRLGYGTVDGLAAIDRAAQGGAVRLCSQPGVRLGVLIADDTTVVYAPTPELIESGAEKPSQPNAIVLDAPPAALASDVGLGAQPTRERTVGLDSVAPVEMEAVRQNLEKNPPARFDLARKVRVYNSYFQFVELELVNCYVSRRKVKLPGYLVGLGANTDLAARFQAQFDLFQGEELAVETGEDDRKITEKSLRKQREVIARNYLISVTGYGMVIAKQQKADFEADVASLRKDVECFMAGVESQVFDHIEKMTKTLVDAFLPSVRQQPPRHFLKYSGRDLTDEKIERLLTEDVGEILAQAVSVAQKMEVRHVYKDIAYEAVQDDKFQVAARKAGLDLDEIFREATAIQEQPAQPTLFDPS